MKRYKITYKDLRSGQVKEDRPIKCFNINNWARVFRLKGFQILEYKNQR